ncbi:MAG: hypothetical protein ABIS51_17020 [Sphingomonas sp.]
MDFDQMLEAWKAQDEKPLYGVNGDLLRLVLQSEQAKIRRKLRRDQWIIYIVGPGMALFAAFWLGVAILNGIPALHVAAAGVGVATFVVWVGAYWVSRGRLMRRERAFGNSLKDEIGRSLSLVEYEIANSRWRPAVLWTAPVLIGSLLIYWLSFQINTDSGFSWWNHATMVFAVLWSIGLTAYAGDRNVKRRLEPRQQHLRELLQALEANE